jgi:hypothetical protein
MRVTSLKGLLGLTYVFFTIDFFILFFYEIFLISCVTSFVAEPRLIWGKFVLFNLSSVVSGQVCFIR